MKLIFPNDCLIKFQNTSRRFVPGIFHERDAVAVFFCFMWVAYRLILNKAYHAQDYNTHIDHINLILAGVLWPWTDTVDAPLFYYIAAPFAAVSGIKYGIPNFALFAAACVFAGLVYFYRSFSLIMTKENGRLAALFLLSLPILVIASVAFAADGLVLLPFFIACALCAKLLQAADTKLSLISLAAIAAIQIFGILSKYTFLSFIPATLLMGLVFLVKRKPLALKQRALAVLIVVIIPAAVNVFIFSHYHQNGGLGSIGLGSAETPIELRSYFPKAVDHDLFEAPTMGDPITRDGKQIFVDLHGHEDESGRPGFKILVENYYSLPGLIHLGITTDYRNLNYGETSPSSWRTHAIHCINRWSIFFSLFFSIAVVLANAVFLWANLKDLFGWLKREGRSALSDRLVFFLSFWVPAFSWFVLILGALPFVANPVYYWGYWTPRLILPAVLVFGAVVFWAMGRMPKPAQTGFKYFVGWLIFLYVNLLLA